MYLLTVQVDTHLVSRCDQIRMDVHLHILTFLVTVHFIFLFTFDIIDVLVHHVSLMVILELSILNIVFFVIYSTFIIFSAILVSLSHHSLSVKLFFAHLIKAILFIMAIRDDTGDGFS